MSIPLKRQRNSVKSLAVLTLALVLGTVLPAQSFITGKWKGATRNGTPVVLNLNAADGKLTGTLTRSEETSTITDGKVVGTTFTFKAVLGEQTEALTGELAGEQLKVWLDRQGREATVVFDRVKE